MKVNPEAAKGYAEQLRVPRFGTVEYQNAIQAGAKEAQKTTKVVSAPSEPTKATPQPTA